MKTGILTSLQHPIVKHCVKLREDRSFRLLHNTALVIGHTLIQELSQHLNIKRVISNLPHVVACDESYIASPEILNKIIGFISEDLIAAEIPLPTPSNLKNTQKILVLDHISDPGNVGAIMRNALAFGLDGVFCVTPTADPFNDKVIRASRGAPFLLPFRQGGWEELKQVLKENKMTLYRADLSGEKLETTLFKTPLALVLGHETRGPSPYAKDLAIPIVIPISPQMESLNVASAAAIFMYQIQLQTLGKQ